MLATLTTPRLHLSQPTNLNLSISQLPHNRQKILSQICSLRSSLHTVEDLHTRHRNTRSQHLHLHLPVAKESRTTGLTKTKKTTLSGTRRTQSPTPATSWQSKVCSTSSRCATWMETGKSQTLAAAKSNSISAFSQSRRKTGVSTTLSLI